MTVGAGNAPQAPLWAPRAWIAGRWAEAVLLVPGADGCWADVQPGVAAPDTAQVLQGAVLPGLVDAHSHAFQRAFAGLAERRDSEHDDFWSWRDRMYQVALRVTPLQLRDIAAQLYVELLRGGYTHVCEFHYLQHAPDGRPYDDPGAMAWALADAAADTGIGLTLLPVLYQRAGFAQPSLRPDQRRFATDADVVLSMQRAARARGLRCGVAIHSLRAATPEAMAQLVDSAEDGPVHIHVAEQTAEVDDCLAATGQRPISWLAAHATLSPRWQLVHATHATPQEIDAVAATGAGIVLCPTTEANLGDGLADLPRWLSAGVPLSIGSDSNVCRDALEELRLAEYGQRLSLRRRNVAAQPGLQAATAARLFDAALQGGASAGGFDRWGLVRGARADLLVADPACDALRGVPPASLLDALVFAGAVRPWRDVMVAGRWVLRDGTHGAGAVPAERFDAAMAELWSDAS
jgi:formimidoylglutamate deiminase